MSAHLMGEIVASDLKEILGGLGCEVSFEEYLSAHTTFQVGGPADALALPKDEGELLELLERCRLGGLPVTVLGGGANTLVRDGGVRGVVISLARGFRSLTLREETKDRALMEAGAGVKIPALVRFAVEGGWEGVECLTGVPGTVGGALAMNAGTARAWLPGRRPPPARAWRTRARFPPAKRMWAHSWQAERSATRRAAPPSAWRRPVWKRRARGSF